MKQQQPRASDIPTTMNRRRIRHQSCQRGCSFLEFLYKNRPPSDMGVSEDMLESMVRGEYFVLARSKSRKTCYVRLSQDHLNLIISGHGCLLKRKKKIRITDIKELQQGHEANYWKKLKRKIPEKNLCFSIIMEKASKKNQNLIGITGQITEEWMRGLLSLFHVIDNLSPEQQQYHWIWKHFKEADKDNNEKLNLSEIYKLFNKISMPISDHHKQYIKVIHRKYDTSGDGMLSFSEILEFFKEITSRPDVNEIFKQYTYEKSDHMTPQELVKFMRKTQGEGEVDIATATSLIKKYEVGLDNGEDNMQMSIRGFTNMLLSEWGSPFKKNDSETVHMDMTKPLSHYFIASSHNTYLSDHQLYGESNISNYQRAIDQGCRCVELDCWDGDDGEPVIYHGHTLTSKILFKHVIEVIRDCAFQKTDFPMLLSIENHCDVAQQDRMITIMKELLGDKLLLAPIEENENALPSPYALRNKIILKAKTLSEGKDDISQELSDSIIYMKSRHFDGFEETRETSTFEYMSSLGEEKAEGLADKETADFIKHTQWQLVRIYPKGTRTKSSNYDPIPMWNVGSQIVALNYQSDDFETYTNLVSFRRNGGCGYLLKPSYLFSPDFNPLTCDESSACARPIGIVVRVISGQQLPKPKDSKDKDVVDPYVQIRVDGCAIDKQTQESSVVEDNGFNPRWLDDELHFAVTFPKLAFMTFNVMDKDSIGNDDLVGRYSIPVDSLATGYRHIFLETLKGESIGPVSIFVYIEIAAK